METKIQLPNSTAVLVLGICSLVFGCFMIGLILGIIGLVLAGKDIKLYKANPDIYDGYSALNAGRIMSIIGVIIGGIAFLYYLIVIVFLGVMLPWAELLEM